MRMEGLCLVQEATANAKLLPVPALLYWGHVHRWFLQPELDKGLVAALDIGREGQTYQRACA